jgi:hypothetical protein
MRLILSKNKRLKFTSKYNVNLYKKCLSLKLVFSSGNAEEFVRMNRLPNLIFNVDDLNKTSIRMRALKCIYARRERIPIRLLRFFDIINKNSNFGSLGCNFTIAQRLSVYNGKELKFINITTGLLETTVKCLYTFGDLIFTRARYKFKKKKSKKKK